MLDVKTALNYIDPSTTDYQKWLQIGMALQHASLTDSSVTWHTWDDWSRGDARPGMYQEGLCEAKWNSFNRSDGYTEGTIFRFALDNGYSPRFDGSDPIEWNGSIEYDGEQNESYLNDTIQYFKLLFKPEDIVSYCLESRYDEDKDKYSPASKGTSRKAQDIIRDLERYQDASLALGDYNHEAGGWVRFNPTDGKGVKNTNITDFRYCLVESDKLSLKDQFKKIIDLKLPCASIVYSGKKSLHAVVHVDAESQEEYTKRVKWIYGVLNDNDFPIDQNNKNPSRMTRLPGLERGRTYQTLVRGRTGLNSFLEWEDYIKNDLDDEELPEIMSYADIIDNPPPLKDELIHGVLRRGHKMIIQGASKSGKSFALIDLTTSVAEGKDWLGFPCEKGKVLYINFEIDEASFWERIKMVYEAKGWKPTPENIEVWNLRGHSMSAQKLIPKIVKRAYSKNFALIVLDPIYKIQAGDENSAGDISKFTNEIDKLVTQLNCSVAYCHHHSKGSQGFKKAMDRSSGSGVFSRDADAIIDVIELSNESYRDKEGYSDKRAFRIEGTLREFAPFEPVNVFYDFPIYRVDTEGILKKAKTYDEGLVSSQPKTTSGKASKKVKEKDVELLRAFKVLDMGNEGMIPADDLCSMLEITNRTLTRWIDNFNKEHTEIQLKRQYGNVKLVNLNEDNKDNEDKMS